MSDASSPVDRFSESCRRYGFDLVRAFPVDGFNATVEEALRLPDFGRRSALGLIVGNSKLLWPFFVRALSNDVALRDAEHPLDRYVVQSIVEASASIDAEHVTLWAHHTSPAAIPIQRIARAAGLAHLSPSHLSVHPAFGPWIALRAVLVVNDEGPEEPPPAPRDPCSSCSQPCVEALQRAVESTGSLEGPAVERHWTLWARVREVCPEGAEHRYDRDQIRYHYAKDRSVLGRRTARE